MTDKGNQAALTAQDVAEALKIAKNTVYELIKRGEINFYKVGRKIRFSQADLDDYIARARPAATPPEAGRPRPERPETARPGLWPAAGEGPFIICGQDVMLDVLANYLSRHPLGRPALRAYVGSYSGLIALYRGEVRAATAHLWDGDTGEYNRPYVRRLLPGLSALLIRLAGRTQGLYVARGNPKGVSGWRDFARPELTMINREKGAGSRVLLDEHLRLLGVGGRSVKGYEREASSHHLVAAAVGRGEADLAVGHQKAAEQVEEVDFIPLQKEQYDLVVKKEDLESPAVQAVLEILRSAEFRREFEPMGGYDLSELGRIVAET